MWCGIRRLHQQAARHVVWDKETTSAGCQTCGVSILWSRVFQWFTNTHVGYNVTQVHFRSLIMVGKHLDLLDV